MANKEISVAIRARDYATAAFERVRQTVASIKDQTINVRANTGTAQSAVQSVRDKLAGIRDKVVSVKVNTGGAEADVAGMNNSLAEFATKAGLAAIAVTALKSALSAGKAAFIDYNAQLEQTRVAFTSMLGSAQLADTMIADLQKFAAETPFEMPGVRSSAQQLLAFGYDANEIIPTLTALGNAASGLGRGQDGFNHLAFVFGQIRTTGQLMGQDVMQLAQLGVPVKDILAKNLGLTKEELARIGELGIDANVAIKALIDGMNERFPEMMKKQSETFEGVLSNIKDNIGQAFGLSGLPLFEDAKNMLLEIKNITDTMLSNAQGGKSIFAGILPDDLIEKASAFGETIKKSLSDAAPVAETLLWSFSKLVDVFLDVGNIALTSMRPIIPVIATIQRLVYGAIGVIASILDTVLEVVLMVQTHVADSWDYIYGITADLWNSAKEIVGDFCTAAIEFMAGIVAEIDAVVSPIVDTFRDTFQEVADWVYEKMADAAGYVQEFIAWVERGIESVKELALVQAATDIGSGISDWVSGTVEETRKRGHVWSAAHFGESAAKVGDGPDGDVIVPQRTEVAVQKDTGVSTWGGGKKSKTHKSTDKAAREAARLAEKIASVTEKVQQSIASLAHDIVNEVGTTYEKGMDALHQKMEQMQKEIKEASDLGIDTTALRAKLDEYANIVKEKVTKAWREANEDLRSETALTWAQVNKDVRAEAEATYQIGVTKLNREKENRLKEVAMTKDSAEARVAVEQWAAAEMARLDQQRLDALREVNKKQIEILQDRGDLQALKNYLADNGALQRGDLELEGQRSLAQTYVKIWNDAHRSVSSYLADAAENVYGTLSNSLSEFIQGAKSAKDVFRDFGKSVLSMMAQIAAQRLAANIMGGFLGNMIGGAGAGTSMLRIPGFAKGGIVTAPTLAMIGEGGEREAVIPLNRDNLSAIGGKGRGGNVTVNVINNTGTQVKAEQTSAQWDGEQWVVGVVLNAVATNRNGIRTVLKGVAAT